MSHDKTIPVWLGWGLRDLVLAWWPDRDFFRDREILQITGPSAPVGAVSDRDLFRIECQAKLVKGAIDDGKASAVVRQVRLGQGAAQVCVSQILSRAAR